MYAAVIAEGQKIVHPIDASSFHATKIDTDPARSAKTNASLSHSRPVGGGPDVRFPTSDTRFRMSSGENPLNTLLNPGFLMPSTHAQGP